MEKRPPGSAPAETLASRSKATASTLNPWTQIASLNDQVLPLNSSDKEVPQFAWKELNRAPVGAGEIEGGPRKRGRGGGVQWVQYDFQKPATISSIGVYWVVDRGARFQLPKGFRVLYRRSTRLRDELILAHADGTYARLLARLERIDVMVIDDWGTGVTQEQERNDLLEIMDDRHGARSTIVASQLPIDKWHARIGDPTIADAILDRLFHDAHRIVLKGPTRRKGEVKSDAN